MLEGQLEKKLKSFFSSYNSILRDAAEPLERLEHNPGRNESVASSLRNNEKMLTLPEAEIVLYNPGIRSGCYIEALEYPDFRLKLLYVDTDESLEYNLLSILSDQPMLGCTLANDVRVDLKFGINLDWEIIESARSKVDTKSNHVLSSNGVFGYIHACADTLVGEYRSLNCREGNPAVTLMLNSYIVLSQSHRNQSDIEHAWLDIPQLGNGEFESFLKFLGR